ncbi:MAG: phosphoribosylformylglycinamidine synthase subunit PurS [candidate division BRC1 bacterium ADurb.BinA364]|nr:MAG: phosphoribosylformylglycinamidine synthase subunit PurS [candidate division BRC1 bacterium ADurb.BinA364]
MLKANVIVTLKKEVSDPRGLAVSQAIQSLGGGAHKVRVGKFFEIELDGMTREEARAQLEEMSHKLLSNPTIEDYRIEFVEGV